MRRLTGAGTPAEAHLLLGILKAEGIAAEVRDEALWGARGELPLDSGTCPSLWVLRDQDFARALSAVARPGGPGSSERPWTCPRCGEEAEAQFSQCWKCGSRKP